MRSLWHYFRFIILFLALCAQGAVSFAAEEAGTADLETVRGKQSAVQTKIEVLEKKSDVVSRELLGVLQQQRVALEQFLALKERKLQTATDAEESQNADRSFENLRKDLARSSFKYLYRLQRSLLILEERYHDTDLLVTSTEKVLAERTEELQALERQLRRLKEEVQSNSPEKFSDLETLRAKTELAGTLVGYHKELLLVSRAELAQQSSSIEALRAEIKAVESILEFSEDDRRELVEEFEKRSQETVAEAQAIDKKLERIEKQLIASKDERKAARKILLEQIRESRSILQQSVLSSVQLSEGYREWVGIQFDYYNGRLDAAAFQDTRRKLEQVLDRLDDTLSWKDRKFSLLVNQMVRVFDREEFPAISQVKELVEEISALIGEQRESIRFMHWHIQKFLEQTRSRFGVREGVSQFTELLAALWNFELIVVDDNPITVSKVVRSLILFFLGLLATRYLTRRLLGRVLERFPLRSGVKVAIQSISFYVLLACFALLALHLVHIPLTIFTLLGGAIAIGVGFGSQNIINNFISGLILLIEQPIRVGDIVEFSGHRGTIQRIGARSTLLLTPENLEVVVPNSYLLENSVTNFTLGSNLVRRSILVGVAYGSPTREVSKLLGKSVDSHGKIHKKPAPDIFFKDFGDNSLLFEVRFWVTMGQYSDALRIESDLRHIVDQKFRDAGIVIAFPQRDVHLDNNDAPLRIELVNSEKKEVVGGE